MITQMKHAVRDTIGAVLGEEWKRSFKIRRGFKYIHGFNPDIRNPRTYTERMCALMCEPLDPRKTLYADKIAVKPQIAALFPDIVIPTLWTGHDIREAPLERLPRPFVIKSNHSTATTIFVRPGDALDIDQIHAQTTEWLERSHGDGTGERHYVDIPPTLLIEPMIGDGRHAPPDYKFFTMRGRVRLLQVDVDRGVDHRRALFFPNGQPLDVQFLYPRPDDAPALPSNLADMVAIAERIGEEFEFARVDLYNVEGRIWFGEVTFVPEANSGKFTPREFDRTLGDLWAMGEPRAATRR